MTNCITDLSTANSKYFVFSLDSLPELSLNCTRVSIPSVSITNIPMQNQNQIYNTTGDTITLDSMSLSFQVDENYLNYEFFLKWLFYLGRSDPDESFANIIFHLKKEKKNYTLLSIVDTILKSSGTLHVKKRNRDTIKTFRFHGLAINNISLDKEFDITSDAVEPQTATVTFDIDRMEIL